jgi:hypothetical protein
MLTHERGDPVEFATVEDAGERIVWIAEQEYLGVRLRAGGLQLGPIERPASALEDHLEFDRIALG